MTNILNSGNILNMGAIIIDKVPDDLRNEFKAECVRRGLSMREVIIRLMEMELDERFSNILKPKGKKK